MYILSIFRTDIRQAVPDVIILFVTQYLSPQVICYHVFTWKPERSAACLPPCVQNFCIGGVMIVDKFTSLSLPHLPPSLTLLPPSLPPSPSFPSSLPSFFSLSPSLSPSLSSPSLPPTHSTTSLQKNAPFGMTDSDLLINSTITPPQIMPPTLATLVPPLPCPPSPHTIPDDPTTERHLVV